MTQQPYYPPQPQAYPQQPPAPQYPSYPPAPQQAYPPQQYAPGYPAPTPAPQAQPLAQGTLDDFYNQPSSGGGAALKFPVVGTRYIGVVSRAIGSGDIQQQTNTQGVPQHFKDGRPKWVMKIPLQMQPTAQHPDGLAQWYVKGAARDELVRAMAEAGAPEGPPEAGAVLDITFSATRSAGPGMNDAKLFSVRYTRPQGSAPGTAAPSPATVPAQPPVQAPPANYHLPPVEQIPPTYAVPGQPLPPLPESAYAPGAQPLPPVQQQAPAAPAQAAPVPPADLSPEQQQLLATLTAAAQQ